MPWQAARSSPTVLIRTPFCRKVQGNAAPTIAQRPGINKIVTLELLWESWYVLPGFPRRIWDILLAQAHQVNRIRYMAAMSGGADRKSSHVRMSFACGLHLRSVSTGGRGVSHKRCATHPGHEEVHGIVGGFGALKMSCRE